VCYNEKYRKKQHDMYKIYTETQVNKKLEIFLKNLIDSVTPEHGR